MTKNQRILLIGAGLLAAFALVIINMVPHVTDDTTNQSTPPAKEPRALVPSSDTANWKTYASVAYGFTVQYPPGFAVEVHEGTSTFEKYYLSLDIGTEEYLAKLKAGQETEGEPLYLRITAAVPYQPMSSREIEEMESCKGGYHFTESLIVDGKIVSKCEGLSLGTFPSFIVVFAANDSLLYSIQSNHYSDNDKVVIEQILSTFKTK